MTLFFTVFVATFLSHLAALSVLGWFAQRAEQKKARMIQEAIQEYNESMTKERQRLEKYAKLEG